MARIARLWLRRRFGVLEVISTIMLNFVAADAVAWLVRGPLQEPTHIYPQTATLPANATMPRLLRDLVPGSRLHAGIILAVAAALVAGWMMRATAPGFRLRAAGANPWAAASAGLIDVPATAPSGRDHWLCWLSGEERVEWWHWPEDGFPGRTRFEDRQPE